MDTIGNLLTSIRNAEMAGLHQINVPYAKISLNILAILEKYGYVKGFSQAEPNTNNNFISINIDIQDEIHNYKRVSKLGRRLYSSWEDIPLIRQGKGMVILSTSKGLMTGRDARKNKVGGELLCTVY